MWQVKIHRLVVEQDCKKMSESTRARILKALFKKLGSAPEEYGAPLRYNLKGFWKLKIGEYRAVYTIHKKEVTVLVLKIGMRRDKKVYKDMLSRIKNHPEP